MDTFLGRMDPTGKHAIVSQLQERFDPDFSYCGWLWSVLHDPRNTMGTPDRCRRPRVSSVSPCGRERSRIWWKMHKLEEDVRTYESIPLTWVSKIPYQTVFLLLLFQSLLKYGLSMNASMKESVTPPHCNKGDESIANPKAQSLACWYGRSVLQSVQGETTEAERACVERGDGVSLVSLEDQRKQRVT